MKSWLDNLFITFGTKNVFKLFLPSLRPLPLNGLEWTVQAINEEIKRRSGMRHYHEDEEEHEIRSLEIDLNGI